MGGAARPDAGGRIGDRVKLHRHRLRLDGRAYTVITPRPGTGVRFSTNRYHGTWHVLSNLRGARLLARLLWGLAYQRIPGTLVLIGAPLLDPNPFDAEPADPIALVPAQLTWLGAQAGRDLRHRLPLGAPDGTVRWHTPGLEPALAAWREQRQIPPGQWRPAWYPPQGPRTRVDRTGGVLVLIAGPRELKNWAVYTGLLGDWLRDGTDSTELDDQCHGEVQVFTGYRQRVSAARQARRDTLADPGCPPEPAGQRQLIWERGAEILARQTGTIIRGGYHVHPRAIEQVLAAHPAVAQVAVTGIPDPRLGQDVGAAVVLKPGTSATPRQLSDFARERLPVTWQPGHIWLANTLPAGPAGKTQPRKLRPPSASQATPSPSRRAQPDQDTARDRT